MTLIQNLSCKKILVVDDSSFIRNHIIDILCQADYEVESAENGILGAEKAFNLRPDLIISDVEMPRMNGYQMCRLLKNTDTTRHIPILICTTLDEAKDRFWAKRTGADSYIVKGFTPEELLATVENCLKNFTTPEKPPKNNNGKMQDIVQEANRILDEKLFEITIINEVRSLSELHQSSQELTKKLLELLAELIDFDLACFFHIEENKLFILTKNQLSYSQKLKNKALVVGNFGSSFALPAEYLPLNPYTTFFCNNQHKELREQKLFSSRLMCRTYSNTNRNQFLIGIYSQRTIKYSEAQEKILNCFATEAAMVLESSLVYEKLEVANQKNLDLQMLLRNYLSKSIWQDALNSVDSGLKVLPEREVEYTILFSDICGFTRFVEHEHPKLVVEKLNNHLTILTEAVHSCNGDVDKYIGDCIMACFAEPKDAIKAAFAFYEALENQRSTEGFAFDIRIGLNTGTVIEAGFGSPVRKDYTVIGDVVNVASRLEAICPVGAVLISQTTYNAVANIVSVISEQELQLKGKEQYVKAYQVTLIPK